MVVGLRTGCGLLPQTEAFESAVQIQMRWWAVDDVRATESQDEVNYQMVDGKLAAVEPVGA